jgi:hypothetical protein
MIQVQIAGQLTLHGVDGIRWVLVEVADTAHLSAAPPAAVLAGAPPGGAAATTAQRPPRALSLALLKLLVTGLGIGAALWVAQATLGPAHLPGWGPAGTNTPPRERLPTHTLPGAAPAAPPASAAEPLVTAVVS